MASQKMKIVRLQHRNTNMTTHGMAQAHLPPRRLSCGPVRARLLAKVGVSRHERKVVSGGFRSRLRPLTEAVLSMRLELRLDLSLTRRSQHQKSYPNIWKSRGSNISLPLRKAAAVSRNEKVKHKQLHSGMKPEMVKAAQHGHRANRGRQTDCHVAGSTAFPVRLQWTGTGRIASPTHCYRSIRRT
ncbi:unnamed protein product [Amoebophrya sp. A25]|nr:unnamed protein product [Amoebophrya sp. A25]|eukprot:GSA25T00005958001.1